MPRKELTIWFWQGRHASTRSQEGGQLRKEVVGLCCVVYRQQSRASGPRAPLIDFAPLPLVLHHLLHFRFYLLARGQGGLVLLLLVHAILLLTFLRRACSTINDDRGDCFEISALVVLGYQSIIRILILGG